MCFVYVFPLVPYYLSVLPLPKNYQLALQQSFSKLLWGSRRPMVRRLVSCQCPHNGGCLGMLDLENHWSTERLAYLGQSLSKDIVWRRKVSDTFPHLKSNPKTVSFGSSRGSERLVDGGGSLAMELGIRFGLLEHLMAYMERVAPFRLELQSRPGRHGRLSSLWLWLWLRRNGWAHLLLLQTSSSVLESRQRVDDLHQTQLVLLDVVDNVLPQFQGEKRVVFLAILAVARMVIWTTWKKGLHGGTNYSHHDLILFFRH